jgi:sugar lactone lactonase YvrE
MEIAGKGEMKVATTWAVVGLLLALIGPVGGAAAGTKDATIFVANQFDVTAYPAGASGDVAPIAVTPDMAAPTGIARDASGRIYVTNRATDTVTVYAANANGNVPPIAVIGGSNTQLANPAAIALDAGGKIYVLNSAQSPRGSSITVYPPLATGIGILNEAPVATIAGSKALLDDPTGVAVDSEGNIYVANESGGPAERHERNDRGKVTVYPVGSDGNVAPIATISGSRTGLSYPLGIALDSSGNIYVANADTANTGSNSTGPSITVYPAGSHGNAAPIAVIAGGNTGLNYPQGIALDSAGNLYAEGYVSEVGYSINTYPAGSNGNVSPTVTIVGADTGLNVPSGIALDSGGNIYVSNDYLEANQPGSVTVYPAGSSGDVVPTVRITSNYTGIELASGIAVDSKGSIYVANEIGGAEEEGSITIYSAGSFAIGPPVATIAGDNTGLYYPFRIAVDSSGNIYVLNSDDAITVYPAGSNGDVIPNATLNIDQSEKNSPTGMAVGPGGALYIANQGGLKCKGRSCHQTSPDSVAVYRTGSDGNAKPTAVISGPDTKLASPSAIAVDHGGEIYVTNEGPIECRHYGKCTVCGPSGPGRINVYAPGSNGDAKPIAEISGSNTGIGSPYGITLDSSGNIYALNGGYVPGGLGGGDSLDSLFGERAAAEQIVGCFVLVDERSVEPILIFPAGSNGDVSPIGGIVGRYTGLTSPAAIAVGPTAPYVRPSF